MGCSDASEIFGHKPEFAESYLSASSDVLEKMLLVSPIGDWANDEEEIARLWVTLRGYQTSFVQTRGFGGDV